MWDAPRTVLQPSIALWRIDETTKRHLPPFSEIREWLGLLGYLFQIIGCAIAFFLWMWALMPLILLFGWLAIICWTPLPVIVAIIYKHYEMKRWDRGAARDTRMTGIGTDRWKENLEEYVKRYVKPREETADA